MKVLHYEDFKYIVDLPTPHDGREVSWWVSTQRIPYIYNTADLGVVHYKFTQEKHATAFALKWL